MPLSYTKEAMPCFPSFHFDWNFISVAVFGLVRSAFPLFQYFLPDLHFIHVARVFPVCCPFKWFIISTVPIFRYRTRGTHWT